MKAMWTRKTLMLAAVVASLCPMSNVHADEWPTRPIRVIVPISPGSAADVIPRIVFDQLTQQLGQPIIVENRPGASSTIGARSVAHAEPDGYTLLAISTAHTIAPATVANMAYDPVKDFAAITSLGRLPNVLVISPSKNIRTVQQLVEAGKVTPITFGSTGIGSPIRLAFERLRQSAGFKATAIPFKGAPEALIEVMTGRVDVYYAAILAALPYIRDGKLIALSVSSRERASLLPDVPTTLEAGFPNSDFNFWIGVFAPANTPRSIIDKLNAEITKALAMPSVQAKLEKLGVQPMPMSTKQFDAYVKEEVEANAALAKAAGITPHVSSAP
jgi:tripartite-type tricarboxylate transporter receptor subunit TctC